MVRWSEGELELYLKGRGGPKAKPQRSKYGNKKTVVDGLTFDSQREAARWIQLRAEERAGTIKNLRRQVPFALVVNRVPCGKYVADFTFERDGKEVVMDAKGHATDLYRLKKKLVYAIYGVTIEEV